MSAGDCQATVIDISRTGARLSGSVLPLVGQQVTFTAETVRAAADVVWCEPGSCAIEFDTPIAIVEVQRLQSFGFGTGSNI
jgi:hypothetical protein